MRITSILLLLLTSALLLQCAKEDNPDTPGGTTSQPAFIPPTQPGYIQTSASSIVLRVGSTATVTAKLYDSYGTAVASQPTFLWSTVDSSVALVNNGIISAVAEGTASIAVSDSAHGISYIDVTVVSSSTTIPAGVYSINYSTPTVVLEKGGNKSFTYRLNNNSGQQISGTVDAFVVDPASGITITNSGTITAGSATGVFYVYARVGTDTIGNPFRIIVYDPDVTNTTPVYEMRILSSPIWFGKKGLSARAVRIEVTESFIDSLGQPTVRVFQTSPTSIVFELPGIIEMGATGRLTSVDYGKVRYKVIYRDKEESLYGVVDFPIDGKWGNDALTFCISSNIRWWSIQYWNWQTPRTFNNTIYDIDAAYLFKGCPSSNDFNIFSTYFSFWVGKGKSPIGPYGKFLVPDFILAADGNMRKCSSSGYIFKRGTLKFVSDDIMTLDFGGTIYTLQRGRGDCVPIIMVTNPVTSVTPTTADVSGTVNYNGTLGITSRGVVWNTSPNPTLSNNRIASGSGTGDFSTTITGLTPATQYYARTYAISSNKDTVYGDQQSFTTLSNLPSEYVSIDGVVTDLSGLSFEPDDELDSLDYKQRGIIYTDYVTEEHGFSFIYKGTLGSTPKTLHFSAPAFMIGWRPDIVFSGINGSNLRMAYGGTTNGDFDYVSSSGTIVKTDGYAIVDGIFKQYSYTDIPTSTWTYIKDVTFKARVRYPY